jgi:hypothetical protein
VEAALEAHGLEAVRAHITATATRPVTDAPILKTSDGQRIAFEDAKLWIERKTTAIERRDSIRFWLTFAVAGVGALAAIVAAWEGWPAVKPKP